jgi:hypothetical protein
MFMEISSMVDRYAITYDSTPGKRNAVVVFAVE